MTTGDTTEYLEHTALSYAAVQSVIRELLNICFSGRGKILKVTADDKGSAFVLANMGNLGPLKCLSLRTLFADGLAGPFNYTSQTTGHATNTCNIPEQSQNILLLFIALSHLGCVHECTKRL